MLNPVDHFEILLRAEMPQIRFFVYPQASKQMDQMFVEDTPVDESMRYHLVEGKIYVYEFVCTNGPSYQFVSPSKIVSFHASSRHPSEGVLNTGVYVGHLALDFHELNSDEVEGTVHFEIRSVKADYETDYRQMLEDISVYYTDLVLQQGALVTQRLEIDPNLSSETLYQRFAFIRSIIDSEEFEEAVHKIISNPIRKWVSVDTKTEITHVKKFSRRNLKQLASETNRVPLPSTLYSHFPAGLTSVPRMLDVESKMDTVDNVENQFVKFVLRTFYTFCSDLKDMKNASDRLKLEAREVMERISGFLDHQFFRQVSMLGFCNMNSPVLQRKEGYREVFQAWLLYDLAAKLNWTGGDDVYEAGKKNVATLYEYWLFFKLKELVSDTFQIDAEDKQNLISPDKDGINLNLKQGHTTLVHGRVELDSRILNVSLYYNRTFPKICTGGNAIDKAGSWSVEMRPDYTVSLWPGLIDEAEAEKQEVITHIHFDAKYRLKQFSHEDASKDPEQHEKSFLADKEAEEMGIYKRGDILKMHAYKDAIRRSSGAYVLYPGTQTKEYRGFHEIVPGLGAFTVRPGHWAEDSNELKQFLLRVKEHLLNRTSQREKMSYYQYGIYHHGMDKQMYAKLPESVNENRDFLPDEVPVLVAHFRTLDQYKWICTKHKYALCLEDLQNPMCLDDTVVSARYILLHDSQDVLNLIRIADKRPVILSRQELLKLNYPSMKGLVDPHADDTYLVFDLDKDLGVEPELENYSWRIQQITIPYLRYQDYTLSLADLIRRLKP